MARLTLKSIDLALDELENKEGLREFDPLSDDIGKALRAVSATHQANSVQLRKKRLADAKRNHKAELKTIQAKQTAEAYRMSPEGQAEQARRCNSLKKQIESNLSSGDEDDAKIDIDTLILECPEDPDIVGYESDFLSIAAAKEDETIKRKAEALGPVASLKATPSIAGKPYFFISWMRGEALMADSFRIERFAESLGERTERISTDLAVKDADVRLGIPYCYGVTPCYRGISGKKTATTELSVCTAPVTGFHVEKAEGTDSFGIVKLAWTNPPWDEAAEVAMRIVREDGKSWDVSGKDTFTEDSVRAGESHRYRLEVTVAGNALDFVECDAFVEAIPVPPPIEGAFASIQGGRPCLSIPKWPDGDFEVKISRPGLKPCYLSREEYGKGFSFHSVEEAAATTLQAVRRCGTNYVPGPETRVSCANKNPILSVSFGSRKTTFLKRMEAFLKQPKAFLKQPEYGMTLGGEEGNNLPPITVSIKSQGGQTRTFPVSSGEIQNGVFFPFPSAWGAKRGESVNVTISEGGYSIRYLTSRKLS